MSYQNGLKTLRTRLLSDATGREAPEEKGVESFIASRAQQAPQESTEDILSRGATWLRDIRKASEEFKKAARSGKNTTNAGKGIADAAKQLAHGLTANVKGKEEESAKDAFVKRRSTSSPSTYAPVTKNNASPIPDDADVKSVLNALAAVESKGSGDYKAIGPKVKKGMYAGQRAYGRYQVMEGNIPSWTKAATGKTYTKEEFMASPEVQDAVAAHQLQKSKDKFGTWEDAASVWFSGRPVSKAGNASDGYTTVPEYIKKFRRNFVM